MIYDFIILISFYSLIFVYTKDLNLEFLNSMSDLQKPKLKTRVSFESKESLGHINKSGHFQRPINRVMSNETDPGMTDKLYKLMENYIPKDIHSIQTR